MKTIEVTTTQNVSIEYELASLRERIFAFLLDFCIIYFTFLAFVYLTFSILGRRLFDSTWMPMVLLAYAPIALFIFYQLFSEVFLKGQTIGKKVLQIKVIRLDGIEPSFSDYFLRSTFHVIDTMLSGGIIAAILIRTSEYHQRLGDLAANTTLIRTRSSNYINLNDILSIETREKYEPVYPQVKELPESNMLLIKNFLNRYHQHANEAHDIALSELVLKLCKELEIKEIPYDSEAFLRTLLKDYIVLTR